MEIWKQTPGWIYYQCPECKMQWRESCIDHKSREKSVCPYTECLSNALSSPYKSEPDPTLMPLGQCGNIVEAIRIEKEL